MTFKEKLEDIIVHIDTYHWGEHYIDSEQVKDISDKIISAVREVVKEAKPDIDEWVMTTDENIITHEAVDQYEANLLKQLKEGEEGGSK